MGRLTGVMRDTKVPTKLKVLLYIKLLQGLAYYTAGRYGL